MTIKATIVSIRFDVTEQKGDKTYQFFKLQYVDKATKENKTYSGMMSALKFNRTLSNALRSLKGGEEVTLAMAPSKFNPKFQELQGVEVDQAQPGTTQAGSPVAETKSTTGYSKGNFETPEERAAKQVYIVRQSSLSTAVSLLAAKKKEATLFEVIDTAKAFEAYVFGRSLAGNETAASQQELVDDIPFQTDDIPQ